MQILNILQGYSSLEFLKELLGIHRVIESIKHMLAIRMDLGDPDFVDVTGDVAEMLSTTFADKVRQRIVDNTTFPPGYYFPKYVCLICVADSIGCSLAGLQPAAIAHSCSGYWRQWHQVEPAGRPRHQPPVRGGR